MPTSPRGTDYVTDTPPHIGDSLTVSSSVTVHRSVLRLDRTYEGRTGTLLGFVGEKALIDDAGDEFCVTAECLLE